VVRVAGSTGLSVCFGSLVHCIVLRWLSKHCRSLVVHVGWPRWHCPYLIRFLPVMHCLPVPMALLQFVVSMLPMATVALLASSLSSSVVDVPMVILTLSVLLVVH
jgi:hypothetical protein